MNDNIRLTINPKLHQLILFLEFEIGMSRKEAIKICGQMFNVIPKKYR